MNIKLRSFESKVLFFNGMYKLPIAAKPSLLPSADYQYSLATTQYTASSTRKLIQDRLRAFKKILLDEVEEVEVIITQLELKEVEDLTILTDLADWLGDLQVYCASEMVRFGLPLKEVLDIIMDSNLSKLGEDGKPIIKDGKVQKGPGYWKPEPQIKALLMLKQEDDLSIQR